DEYGYPLPGANVVVNGSANTAQTDFDGYYSLDAPVGSSLTISYIGFQSEVVWIRKSETVNVVLREDAHTLDEVVTIARGYSVSSGDETVIEYEEAMEELGGQAKGVQVMIRGSNTAVAGSRPLYVVDGVIVSDLNLNPGDIEDTYLLEGTAATSLYGSKGIHGVLIITTKAALSSALQAEFRSDLKETAFFFPQLRTDKNGAIDLEFTSPQALTKWRLMLFGHTRNLEHGALDKSVITQKEISIVPNYPRFIREKDTLFYSVKISNLTAETLTGVSILEIEDAMTMEAVTAQVIKGPRNQTFQLAPKANAEVTWMLTIPRGMGALQIKTVATAGQKSDGEVKIIPVLSNRVMVSESKPVWVPPGAEKSVTLENLKTHTSGSIKHHRFTLEYTSNPAWLALKSLPYLMDYPYECAEQTFARYYSNAIAESILESHPDIETVFRSWASDTITESPLEKNPELKSRIVSESPWLRDAESEKENNARLGRAFTGEGVQDRQAEAIATLRQLQLPSGGFPWFAGGSENRYITRHILAGFGHLAKLGIESANGDGEETIIRKALDYLDGEFIADHKRRLEQDPEISRINPDRSDIHYLYMRSFFLEHHPLTEEQRGIIDQYLKSGEADWLTYSVYEKGMVALALHRFGKPPTSREILEALEEQAVYSEENGMYWKENEP
ncbi:carboxypeptidase-like regulatory domain-containing protein, partial [Robiginitalea sp.]|uniref:carboxypeptidase-like regulatory domain-containing protein n=1 Tax=Robiginitalea sp. TaxID=1902411 RepID=UPI003C5C8390